MDSLKTLNAHFKHYYGNTSNVKSLANLYHDYGKVKKGISIGIAYSSISSMLTPLEFINSHKEIPSFENLPKNEQNKILEIEKAMQDVKKFFGPSNFKNQSFEERLVDLIEKDQQEEVLKLVDEAWELWDKFGLKIESLIEFKSVYK